MVQSSSCRGPVKTATPRKTSIRKRTHIFLMNFANVRFCLSSLRGDISTIRLASCFFSFIKYFWYKCLLGAIAFVFSVTRVCVQCFARLEFVEGSINVENPFQIVGYRFYALKVQVPRAFFNFFPTPNMSAGFPFA